MPRQTLPSIKGAESELRLVLRLLPPHEISVSSFRWSKSFPWIEQRCRCYGPLKAMPTSTGGMVVALQRQPLPFF
jgi:hypothetical protein